MKLWQPCMRGTPGAPGCVRASWRAARCRRAGAPRRRSGPAAAGRPRGSARTPRMHGYWLHECPLEGSAAAQVAAGGGLSHAVRAPCSAQAAPRQGRAGGSGCAAERPPQLRTVLEPRFNVHQDGWLLPSGCTLSTSRMEPAVCACGYARWPSLADTRQAQKLSPLSPRISCRSAWKRLGGSGPRGAHHGARGDQVAHLDARVGQRERGRGGRRGQLAAVGLQHDAEHVHAGLGEAAQAHRARQRRRQRCRQLPLCVALRACRVSRRLASAHTSQDFPHGQHATPRWQDRAPSSTQLAVLICVYRTWPWLG